jgi:hypothetical protein
MPNDRVMVALSKLRSHFLEKKSALLGSTNLGLHHFSNRPEWG